MGLWGGRGGGSGIVSVSQMPCCHAKGIDQREERLVCRFKEVSFNPEEEKLIRRRL